MVTAPWIVAHVVGERPPTLFSWLVAIVFGLGLLGAVVTHGRNRRVLAVVAAVGLAASVWDTYARGVRPPRPDLVIRLVQPGDRSSRPMAVEVCGWNHAGHPVSPTADSRLLLIRVGGVQVAEIHQSRAILPIAPGRQIVSVEVNSPYHQEFQPPLEITRKVSISRTSRPISFRRC